MNKYLTTTAMVLTLAFSAVAYADEGWHDKGEHHGFYEEALSKLPEKDAASFRDAMKQGHEKDKALFEQMHKLHDELKAIVSAETFDKAAYLAKAKELDKLHEKIHANMRENFANAIAKLPQDERQTLAESMHHMHGHHGHHDSEKSDSGSAAPGSNPQ